MSNIKGFILSTAGVAAILTTLTSSAFADHRAGMNYVYTDEAEMRVCLANTASFLDILVIPFGGRLCNGTPQPFKSANALQSIKGGDACKFKDTRGIEVPGTKYSCAANEGALARLGISISASGQIFPVATPLNPAAAQGASTGGTAGAGARAAVESLVGKSPASPAERTLTDEFITTLFDQHPHLLLSPEKYPMPKIRSAMNTAAKAYQNWLAANKSLQRKADAKIPDRALRRAFAAQYDPAYLDDFKKRTHMIIFDLTKPESDRRFYVINVQTKKTQRYLVKHGIGSGAGEYAENVGNRPNSNMTPFGFHYTGKEEWSPGLRRMKIYLTGLESINSNSYIRGILIHGSTRIDEETGFLKGKTHGCAGLDYDIYKQLAPTLKGGNLMLFYHRELEAAYKRQQEQKIFKEHLRKYAQNNR